MAEAEVSHFTLALLVTRAVNILPQEARLIDHMGTGRSCRWARHSASPPHIRWNYRDLFLLDGGQGGVAAILQ